MSTTIPSDSTGNVKTSGSRRTISIANQSGYSGSLNFTITFGADAGSHTMLYPTNQHPEQQVTFSFSEEDTLMFHNALPTNPAIIVDALPA